MYQESRWTLICSLIIICLKRALLEFINSSTGQKKKLVAASERGGEGEKETFFDYRNRFEASEIVEHLVFGEAARDELKVMAVFWTPPQGGREEWGLQRSTQPTGKSQEPKLWISTEAITVWLSTHHIINTKPLKVKIYPHPLPSSFAISHNPTAAFFPSSSSPFPFTPQRAALICSDWAAF